MGRLPPAGLWIFLDLSVIALGAGAFFTGFLLYVLKKVELRAVINSAVVLGFICYSGAVAILAVDVGQPLRAWFTFWHPNTHSMLTEVSFCIITYLVVLAIEYVPVILKNRRLRSVPKYIVFEWELHKVIPVFALVGTFLSFFHQGSLGGLYGVLRGRPFAFREGFGLWPSTFFLFVLSAAAVGPSFIIATTWLVSKVTGKRWPATMFTSGWREFRDGFCSRTRYSKRLTHSYGSIRHRLAQASKPTTSTCSRRSGPGFSLPRSSCSASHLLCC